MKVTKIYEVKLRDIHGKSEEITSDLIIIPHLHIRQQRNSHTLCDQDHDRNRISWPLFQGKRYM